MQTFIFLSEFSNLSLRLNSAYQNGYLLTRFSNIFGNWENGCNGSAILMVVHSYLDSVLSAKHRDIVSLANVVFLYIGFQIPHTCMQKGAVF